MSEVLLDFSDDPLNRQKFADLLITYSKKLAEAKTTPAGRVIAVDAPWGSGKSYIAQRLKGHFENHKNIHSCVYIDAFEFDYHQDPFAVVTSAILASTEKNTPAVKSLKKAAANVIKAGLPALGKGVLKAAGKFTGIDSVELANSILEAAEDASEKAIEKMLTTFEETKKTTKAFQTKLAELAANESKEPLVIVIDELDRCRPSFALEMLERVKHLFDVPNVVFIFFIYTPALHSAVKKTYGQEIDSIEYLRKFFSITLGLPVAATSNFSFNTKSEFITKFLDSKYPKSMPPSRSAEEFRASLCCFAPLFNASLRDIENAMLFSEFIKTDVMNMPTESAYALLIKVRDMTAFNQLKNKTVDAYKAELSRLDLLKSGDEYENGKLSYLRNIFTYAVDPKAYESNFSNQAGQFREKRDVRECRDGLSVLHQALKNLELEYIKI